MTSILDQNLVLNTSNFPSIKGDGLTDDTIALQAAFDMAGAQQLSLWLTNDAVYKITSPLLIKFNNFKLFGNHAEIDYYGTSGAAIDAQLISSIYPQSVVAQDLNIVLKASGTTAIGWNHRFSRSFLRNVSVAVNFPGQTGFALPGDTNGTGPHYNTFEDCSVQGSENMVKTGTGPSAVFVDGISVAPYSIVLKITAGGSLGAAQFKWSSDGGSTFTTGVTVVSSVVLGSIGLTAYFPAGTYVLGTTYTCQTAQTGWLFSFNNSFPILCPNANLFLHSRTKQIETGWSICGNKNTLMLPVCEGSTGQSFLVNNALSSSGAIYNSIIGAYVSGDTDSIGFNIGSNAVDTVVQDPLITNTIVPLTDSGIRSHISFAYTLTNITSSYVISTTDRIVSVGTISSPITISLPSLPIKGLLFKIKDSSGSAFAHNISISTTDGSTIDGSISPVILNSNYQSVEVMYNGTQWNIL
jgi:hypothetical protein